MNDYANRADKLRDFSEPFPWHYIAAFALVLLLWVAGSLERFDRATRPVEVVREPHHS